MNESIIIALDFSTKNEVDQFLNHFHDESLFVKVGMELYYQEGPSIIQRIKEKGHHIFLDLKLHDIPNTVYRAMKGLSKLNVDLVNVHALGGKEMMMAAIQGLEDGTINGQRPRCIAVTQLTSTTEEQMKKEQLVQTTLQDSVLHFATLTKESGLDGVVCSVHESLIIRERLGDSFYIVTPGIRLSTDQTDDQKRVATPAYAKEQKVSHIVVGRSITKKENPKEAYWQIKREWEMDR